MTSLPLVSVIIPTYNCSAYIRQTIDSVLAQTYSNIELLVIDDGSTDNTINIIQEYGYRLQLICKDNAGVSSARNLGIEKASGQYVCFLDHDDYWYPGKISQQVEAFVNCPEVGIVYSCFKCWLPDEQGNFSSPDSMDVVPISSEIEPDFSGWIYHLLLLDCWVLTSTAMINTDVFQSCGIFDESLPYSEDWELWLRVARKYQFIKLRGTTTLYRQHHQQGNRLVRPVDYRTKLLINAKRRWGLCSSDGRCLPIQQFNRQLAKYHADYGLHQLKAGSKKESFISLAKAWVLFPLNIKYLAYILAGCIGWRPTY